MAFLPEISIKRSIETRNGFLKILWIQELEVPFWNIKMGWDAEAAAGLHIFPDKEES